MRTCMIRISTAAALLMGVTGPVVVLVAQTSSGTRSSDPNPFNTEAALKAGAAAVRAQAELMDWTPPRTPWGDPDLRGVWYVATYTPLQRAPELANKPFYTEEEAVAAFKKAVEADAEVDPRTVHYDWKEYGMEAWQGGVRPNLRTSLIVDPPDGRQPPLTAEAEQRRAARAAAARQRAPSAGVSTLRNMATRCILGHWFGPLVRGGNPGAASAATAAGVTAEAQLFQAPGYMVIVTQSNNDVRIIPLDGRPTLPSNVRQWLGDSRGRWDGNTLVVESRNFAERFPVNNGPFFHGSTEALHMVERFTRVAPDTIRYEYTVNDPGIWTRRWSAEAYLPKVEPTVIFEFACHEQNYGLINVVRGTQTREREGGGRSRTGRERLIDD